MLNVVTIGDLGEVYTGNTPSKNNVEYYEANHIMFIKPDIMSFDIAEIEETNEYISEKARDKARIVPKNSLLVSCIGNIGKLAINKKEASFNQQINAIVHNSKIISSKYLAYLLKYNQRKLSDIANAPIVPIINKTQFSNFKVQIHEDLSIQKKIVNILDKSQELINKRKAQIEALDELVKSQFIEMFGEEKYPLVKTEDVCEYITKGTTPKTNEIMEEYEEGLIPYLKVYNLSFDGSMLFDDKPQYVTEETHNKFLARSKVFPNDVLMNIVGPPLGKFSLVPNTFSEWNINQAMAIFRATNKINSIYLLHALKQPRVLKPFIDLAVGVRQQNLSLLQCRNLEIPLPPLELQNQFANFVKQVDKLKFEVEKSLKELEDNFNSLMQKAFNGQLFNK
ncbi:MAG: restriction endonuclease subunit S [Clostridium butyricum]|nr:restriction endonuclease subunit S [Clostridium butyricum]MDU3594760.1 restriction endonuclease subunit S [Clostridium butyricum]